RAVYEAFDTGKLNDCIWKSGFTEVHNCSYRGERPKTHTDSTKSSGSTGINNIGHSDTGSSNSEAGSSRLGSTTNILPHQEQVNRVSVHLRVLLQILGNLLVQKVMVREPIYRILIIMSRI
ncbi:hypothetical protein, partial [Arsenophonus sp.]